MSFEVPKEEEYTVAKSLKEQLFQSDIGEVLLASNYSELTFVRFLRGRKHGEEKAYRALYRNLEWRKDHSVNSIFDQIPEFLSELNAEKIVQHGVDRAGHPVIYMLANRHDRAHSSPERLRQLVIYTMEKVMRDVNPENERVLVVFDLAGFSLMHMDNDFVKMLVNIMAFNCPETMESTLIVNAPFMFRACWALIKGFLDPVTVSKVKFIVERKELFEFIAPEDLHPHVKH